jgi:hypothetical protein
VKEQDAHQVEIIDLYRHEIQQPFFTFTDANTMQKTDEMRYFQENISTSDELIFISS